MPAIYLYDYPTKAQILMFFDVSSFNWMLDSLGFLDYKIDTITSNSKGINR